MSERNGSAAGNGNGGTREISASAWELLEQLQLAALLLISIPILGALRTAEWLFLHRKISRRKERSAEA